VTRHETKGVPGTLRRTASFFTANGGELQQKDKEKEVEVNKVRMKNEQMIFKERGRRRE